MAIPVIYPIIAFDATEDKIITFSFSGFQVVKNRILVKNNATGTTIFDDTVTSFQLSHTIPAETLENGLVYNIVVYAINSSDVSSSPSATVLFKCYETPTWSFSNLVEDQIITNSSYGVELAYTQSEGELLNQYQVSLYNSAQSLLYQTGILYNTTTLAATISGLNDNSQYYIRATGVTLNGMTLDTGYVHVSVEYTQPALFSLVSLENIPRDGNIKITSNIILLVGTSNPDPATYISGTLVDLTVDGSYVKFDEGFMIPNDFTIQCIGRDFTDYSTILELSNGTYNVELIYMRGEFTGITGEKAYFILNAYNSVTNYTITSNLIDVPLSTDRIHIWIKRINNIYDLIIENLGA